MPSILNPDCQSSCMPRTVRYVAHALYALPLSDTEASVANTSPSFDGWRSCNSSLVTTVVENGVSSCERVPSAPLPTSSFRCCVVSCAAVTLTVGSALSSLSADADGDAGVDAGGTDCASAA